jgi:hypothetical protein
MGFLCCLWSSYCFGGYSGLVTSLVRYVEFPFFLIYFVLVFCSGISFVPLELYVILWGSGSSLLRGYVMYVISLSIHGVISLVRTYRRCLPDSWSTWR